MRRDVEFVADGTTLRGWLYTPDEGDSPFPTVIMSHGFSAVKEQIQLTAEVFVEAGMSVLLYDHRNLGASDGEPRQDIDPWAQIRDMRDAITYAQSLEEVDPDSVGIWGTSYSGGHVLAVGGIDKRVKCVVSQVPLVAGIDNFRRIVAAEQFPELQKGIDADRAALMRGEPTGTMPIASLDPAEAVAFPGPRTHYFLVEHEVGQSGPNWRNECTLRSIDRALEYDVIPSPGK